MTKKDLENLLMRIYETLLSEYSDDPILEKANNNAPGYVNPMLYEIKRAVLPESLAKCSFCGDMVEPRSIIDGYCEDCARTEFPNGRILDSDFNSLEEIN